MGSNVYNKEIMELLCTHQEDLSPQVCLSVLGGGNCFFLFFFYPRPSNSGIATVWEHFGICELIMLPCRGAMRARHAQPENAYKNQTAMSPLL